MQTQTNITVRSSAPLLDYKPALDIAYEQLEAGQISRTLEEKSMKHLIELSKTASRMWGHISPGRLCLIRGFARGWLAGALLLLSGAGLHAQLCSSWRCFNPAPIPISPSGSTGRGAANILSPYSQAQDAINNTFNQFRSILRNRQTTEPDTSESVNVPNNSTESDSEIEADIEQMRIEREAREAAERARQVEEQRNREAANLLQSANNLLQSSAPSVDCAALMSTYYSGNPPALPSQCMTDEERMSVYTASSPQQIAAIVSPEPVIDGGTISSVINFSPALQELADQTAVPPAGGDTSNPTPADGTTSQSEDPVQGSSVLDQLRDTAGSKIQPTDDVGSPAAPSATPEDGTTSQSEDQAEGSRVLDQLRDTAVKDWDSVKQAGQSALEFAIDQAPKVALKLTDEDRAVMIPDPAAAGASSLIQTYGLPSAISNIAGKQIANSLESKLLDLGTNWDQVNADPNGQDSLDFSRAQAPYKVYQLYNYPAGILKVLDDKLGNFNDQPSASTPSSNQ